MKRNLLFMMLMAWTAMSSHAQRSDFVKGADMGFLQGQERQGVVFHDSKAAPTAIMEGFVE